MPMASDLWARQRGDEVLRRLVLSTRAVLQVSLPVAAGFALFNSDTIDFWLGPGSPEVADAILVILMIVQVPTLTAAPAEQVLVGIGRVRAVGLLTLAEGTSNLAISIVLVYAYGAIGAALGTLVTSALISPIKVPLACRALGTSVPDFLRKTVLFAVASSVPALVGMSVVWLTMSEGVARLLVGLAVGAILTIAVGVAQIGPVRLATALRGLGARGPGDLVSAGSSRS
jgi:O-antigen/teichoic acid export membrane protein